MWLTFICGIWEWDSVSQNENKTHLDLIWEYVLKNQPNCILITTSKDIEITIEKVPAKKRQGPDCFSENSTKHVKNKLYLFPQNIECQRTCLNSCQEASKTLIAKPNHHEKTVGQHLHAKPSTNTCKPDPMAYWMDYMAQPVRMWRWFNIKQSNQCVTLQQ